MGKKKRKISVRLKTKQDIVQESYEDDYEGLNSLFSFVDDKKEENKPLPSPFEDDYEDESVKIALGQVDSNGSVIEQDEDDDILNSFLLSSMENNDNREKEYKKQRKREKKLEKEAKKKHKEEEERIEEEQDEVMNLFLGEENIDEEDKPKKKKKKNKKKKKIELNKEADDFYEKRFRGSVILLGSLMKDNSAKNAILDRYLEKVDTGKIKVSPTAFANVISASNALNSTRLSIIKELTAVNVKISDLEQKRAAHLLKTGALNKDKDQDESLMMDKMWDKISKQKKGEGYSVNYDEDDDEDSKSIDDRIDELIGNGDISLTDTESAFKYEKEGVKVVIYKHPKNNRWRFAALDSDGDELADYPLPNKETVKVKFDPTSDIAKDNVNRVYKVIWTKDLNGGFDDYEEDSDAMFENEGNEYEHVEETKGFDMIGEDDECFGSIEDEDVYNDMDEYEE